MGASKIITVFGATGALGLTFNNFNIADDDAAFSLYANQWTGSNIQNMEVNGGAGSYTTGTTVVLDRIITGTTSAGPSSISLYKDGSQVGTTATSELKLCYKRFGGDAECALN